MTGYFSRLIQQSGIVVARGRETPLEKAPSPSGISTGPQEGESGNVGDLLQVEDVEVMVPPTEPAPPHRAPAIEEEDTVSLPEVREEPPTLERVVEREIISPSVNEFVIQEGPATDARRDQIEIDESVSRSQNPQRRHPASDSTIPEGTVVIEPSEIKQPEVKQPEEKRGEMFSPQTYWQVVREWVADRPQKEDGGQEVDLRRDTTFSEPTETEFVNAPQPPQADPEMVETLDTARVEHQELVLSIGSIQVTVEQPPMAIKPSAPPAPQPKPRTQSSLESSRLRRHYIRFR
jgi:hypothetical protein